MKIRTPAVEGRFYPGTADQILGQIRRMDRSGRYPDPELMPGRIFGAVLPHAGHVYSGYQTVPFFHILVKSETFPETFIIVHPNHTGRGLPLAVDDSDAWSNSLGQVALDTEFAEAMALPFDSTAHTQEHSGEVLLPYIQYFLAGQDYRIVPVCMGDQCTERADRVASAIVEAEEKTGRRIIVLASSDFSHFLSPGEGHASDQWVVDEILARNIPGVEQAVRRHRITMCGYGPVMALMSYAASRDPGYRISLLARGHSGEVIPSSEVVDYISFVAYS
jgi:AmmeMemoRadiSam system protein B